MPNRPNIWASGANFDAVKFNALIQRGVPVDQAIAQAGGVPQSGPMQSQSAFAVSKPVGAELPPLANQTSPPVYEDDEEDDQAPGFAAAAGDADDLTGLSVRDTAAQRAKAQSAYDAGYGDLVQRYKDAEENIRQQRQQSMFSPENLLALSAAFFQPTRSRGFGGAMANVLPVLQNAAAQREADERKKQELLREYGMETSKLQLGYLDKNLASADRAYLAAARAAAKPPSMGVWSENLQRFVPKDQPTVIQSGSMKDGRRTEKMSDGSLRVYNGDGSYSVYDAGGKLITQGRG